MRVKMVSLSSLAIEHACKNGLSFFLSNYPQCNSFLKNLICLLSKMQVVFFDGAFVDVDDYFKVRNRKRSFHGTIWNGQNREMNLFLTSTTLWLSSLLVISVLVLHLLRYEIFMDEVKPEDLSVAFLREFMKLPRSYFDERAPTKYRKYRQKYLREK